MPLIFNVLIPSIAWKKENFYIQLNTFGVFKMPFQHLYYFLLSFYRSLLTFLFFWFFSIFQRLWCCLGVFFLLTKLRLFSNQNITPI